MTITTYKFSDVESIDSLKDTARKAFRSGSTDSVGRAIHESLLNTMRQNPEYEPQAFAVTESRVLFYSVNAETNEARKLLAREAGRAFCDSAIEHDELINFVGNVATGTYRETQTDVATTFVADMNPFNEANSSNQLVKAFEQHENLVFIDELERGKVINTEADGALQISADVYKNMSDEERVGKTTAVNYLLLESLIGAIPAIPFYRATEAAN